MLSTSPFKGLPLALVTLSIALISNQTMLAQVPCDPSIAPSNLQVDDFPTGLLLSWDATPGSVVSRLKADLPGGGSIGKNLVGSEPDQLFIPSSALTPGTYVWRVRGGCTLSPPYDLTAFSGADTFVYAPAGTCPLTVADEEGNIYDVIDINGTCWMQENLVARNFANGDPIPTGLSNASWISTSAPAYAEYGGTDAQVGVYGLLYNWYAVDDSRGICPIGWHVPSEGDWAILKSDFGGPGQAGGAIKATGTLSGTGLWQGPNAGATNASGFTGLPAGYRQATNGISSFRSFNGIWWSTTPTSDPDRANGERAFYDSNDLLQGNFLKQLGVSVRCIQD